jgi:hypothetical protein
MTGEWVQITTDGLHNKEPDWVPIPAQSPQPQPKKKTTPRKRTRQDFRRR